MWIWHRIYKNHQILFTSFQNSAGIIYHNDHKWFLYYTTQRDSDNHVKGTTKLHHCCYHYRYCHPPNKQDNIITIYKEQPKSIMMVISLRPICVPILTKTCAQKKSICAQVVHYLLQESAKLLKLLHGNLHKSFILCCKICQSITLICTDVATRVIELCLVLVENNPCLCLGSTLLYPVSLCERRLDDRWSIQRANGQCRDHLIGQLTTVWAVGTGQPHIVKIC